MQIELFENDTIHSDAEFIGNYRIRLSRDWSDGPRALVIGCNPSTADAFADDPTSRWWNNWFRAAGFGGYDAANLYPFCTSSPRECRNIVDAKSVDTQQALNDINLPELVRLAQRADQIFVCWGAIAWDDLWVRYVCEAIQLAVQPSPELWCWGITKSGAPKHPLARGRHRIPSGQAAISWGL